MSEFQVQRNDLTTTRIVESTGGSDIGEHEILAKIDRFAFTANNITYGVVGDQLGYWQFFPPAGDNSDGWGVIPVWGFADVVQSNTPEVPVGERLFGYFPPATHLKLTPTRITAGNLVDGAPHRAHLPAGYNNYWRVNHEPGYDRATDALRMLFFPLYVTSFCLWDALQMAAWHEAGQVIIVSASSKTSIGLAYALDRDADAPPVVAVTSERNRAFVDGLKLYGSSVSYTSLSDVDAGIPSVIVDMSGNDDTLTALATHLGNNLRHCIRVGVTHRNAASGKARLERSSWFFAPGHIEQRIKDWGPDGFRARSTEFINAASAMSGDWLQIVPVDGLAGLEAIFADVADGRIPAAEGLVVEL